MTHPRATVLSALHTSYAAHEHSPCHGAPAGFRRSDASRDRPRRCMRTSRPPRSRLALLPQEASATPNTVRASQPSPAPGRWAGAADANFMSAEVESVAGETRRRMFEARSAEFASPPPRRPPPRAARSEAKGRECRRRPPPRPRGRSKPRPRPIHHTPLHRTTPPTTQRPHPGLRPATPTPKARRLAPAPTPRTRTISVKCRAWIRPRPTSRTTS